MIYFCPENDRDLASDLHADWSRVDSPPENCPFTGSEKLNVEMDEKCPINFFKLFVNDDSIENLVTQTNMYANNRTEAGNRDGTFRPHSRQKKWQPVALDKMKVFLSLVIAMGLVVKSDLEKYWACHETHDTPFFRKNMSRDRFQAILSNIHVSDNETATIFSPAELMRDQRLHLVQKVWY